jgi:hypothetical protein
LAERHYCYVELSRQKVAMDGKSCPLPHACWAMIVARVKEAHGDGSPEQDEPSVLFWA